MEIRSSFLAARTQLPVMVIITPQDRRGSVWTQDSPSAQVYVIPPPTSIPHPKENSDLGLTSHLYPQILQQLVVLAAESLSILEKQLMDPHGPGDIRVSS